MEEIFNAITRKKSVNGIGTPVNSTTELSSIAKVETLIYVEETSSFWQKTASGWIDTEADVKNQNVTLLTPLEI
jgi:hypothetical protein